MKTILPNRKEAGRRLAKQLTAYVNHPQAIVLGLARGGVPVAHQIAKELNLPLDVCLVKKLGLPNFSETTIGAIAEDALVHDYSGNITIIDENTAQIDQVDPQQLKAIAAKEKAELRWRDRCYRSFRPMLKVRDRIVILVDDGMATGCTMHAAITALRQHQPDKIIVAIPVASSMAIEQAKSQVDKVVCLLTPKPFQAIDFCYKDFSLITDCQVCDLLSQETQKSLVATY